MLCTSPSSSSPKSTNSKSDSDSNSTTRITLAPQFDNAADDGLDLDPHQANRRTASSPPPPCAFVGALGSPISKITALGTGLRSIPQISPSSSSNALGNKTEYPLFRRTVSDDQFLADIFVRFLHNTLGVQYFYVVYKSSAAPRSEIKSLIDAIRKLGWAPEKQTTTTTMATAKTTAMPCIWKTE